MEDKKIGELPNCSPSLEKKEKNQASPIGKRRLVAYFSPKPTIRRVIKKEFIGKRKETGTCTNLQVGNLVNMWERKAINYLKKMLISLKPCQKIENNH